jgi:hypothetical protein
MKELQTRDIDPEQGVRFAETSFPSSEALQSARMQIE